MCLTPLLEPLAHLLAILVVIVAGAGASSRRMIEQEVTQVGRDAEH